MSLEELTHKLRRKVAENPSLGYRVLFDLGAEGVIFWDGTVVPARIDNERDEADTTMTTDAAYLAKMLDGAGSPTMAYMTGKLRVSGSLGVALKINSMLED